MKSILLSLLTAIAVAVLPTNSYGATPEEIAIKTTPRKQCDSPIGGISVSFSDDALNLLESGETVKDPRGLVMKALVATGCFEEGTDYTLLVNTLSTKADIKGAFLFVASGVINATSGVSIKRGPTELLTGRGVGGFDFTGIGGVGSFGGVAPEILFASSIVATLNNMNLPAIASAKPAVQKTAAIQQ